MLRMVTRRQDEYPPISDDCEPPRRVTPVEFHQLAEQFSGKYEYHNGLMYPLASLQKYLILDNRRQEATLYRKSGTAWLQRTAIERDEIPLENIGLQLPMAHVYRGIALDPDPTK